MDSAGGGGGTEDGDAPDRWEVVSGKKAMVSTGGGAALQPGPVDVVGDGRVGLGFLTSQTNY